MLLSSKLFHGVALARLWKLSTKTLQKWRIKGKEPAYIKIANLVRYRRQDIEAFEKLHPQVVKDAALNDQS